MVISAQIGKKCFVLIIRPQPDTLSPLLLSSWCPEQKPQPEKVLRERIPLPGSPLLLEKHSPAQWIGTKDLVRGWAPQASLEVLRDGEQVGTHFLAPARLPVPTYNRN